MPPHSEHSDDETGTPMSPTPRSPGGHALKPEEPADLRLARSTDGHKGLTSAEVEASFLIHGKNELADKKINPILQFLAYL
jgi:hypothetical protein